MYAFPSAFYFIFRFAFRNPCASASTFTRAFYASPAPARPYCTEHNPKQLERKRPQQLDEFLRSDHRVVVYVDSSLPTVQAITNTRNIISLFSKKVPLAVSVLVPVPVGRVTLVQGVPSDKVLVTNVAGDYARQGWLKRVNGGRRVYYPQCFIGDVHIGVHLHTYIFSSSIQRRLTIASVIAHHSLHVQTWEELQQAEQEGKVARLLAQDLRSSLMLSADSAHLSALCPRIFVVAVCCFSRPFASTLHLSLLLYLCICSCSANRFRRLAWGGGASTAARGTRSGRS
jgi:hypothetical protein